MFYKSFIVSEHIHKIILYAHLYKREPLVSRIILYSSDAFLHNVTFITT